jgi:hypothetical protein
LRHGRRNRAGAASCDGEQRSRGPGARSALRLLTCGVLFERRARSAQSELRRTALDEQRSGVSAQR